MQVRVNLVIHREVILERFHLILYGTSRLVCAQSKKTTEQEITRTTYDVLEGEPVIFESGTLKYDITFVFPENRLLVPSQHVLLPDGSLSQFSYFVKAECTTLEGLELRAIKTLEIKPSLQGLRLYTISSPRQKLSLIRFDSWRFFPGAFSFKKAEAKRSF